MKLKECVYLLLPFLVALIFLAGCVPEEFTQEQASINKASINKSSIDKTTINKSTIDIPKLNGTEENDTKKGGGGGDKEEASDETQTEKDEEEDEKQEEAGNMQDLKLPCKDGETTRKLIKSEQEGFTLKGVEFVSVGDMQGFYGSLTEDEKKAAVEALSKALKGNTVSGVLAKSYSLTTKLISGNIGGIIYDLAMGQVKSKIADILTDWVKNQKVSGTPVWIDIEYGRLWDVPGVVRVDEYGTYICCPETHKWVLQGETERIANPPITWGKCIYTAPGAPIRYTINIEDIDLTGCTKGSCPNAWADAINKAISHALNTPPLAGRVVGKCPGR